MRCVSIGGRRMPPSTPPEGGKRQNVSNARWWCGWHTTNERGKINTLNTVGDDCKRMCNRIYVKKRRKKGGIRDNESSVVGIVFARGVSFFVLHPGTFEIHRATRVVTYRTVPIMVEEEEHCDEENCDVEDERHHLESPNHSLPSTVHVVLRNQSTQVFPNTPDASLDFVDVLDEILDCLVKVLIDEQIIVLGDAHSTSQSLTGRGRAFILCVQLVLIPSLIGSSGG